MATRLALSSFLVGDPLHPAAAIHSPADLLHAIDASLPSEPGVLAIAPRVALVFSLEAGAGSVTLRGVSLAPGSTLAGVGLTDLAVVLAAPLGESGIAIRLLASPLSSADLLVLLGSAPSGLSAPEAGRRLQICGRNQLEQVRRRPLGVRLLEQFTSFFAVLLWMAGAIAFLGRMPELAAAIFAVIVVNGAFSFIQLEEGDQVPADGQLLGVEGLSVDQSPLTGESRLVFKLPALANEREGVPLYERRELVFAGTGVMAGTGTFVVSATGMGTEIGGIAHLTQSVIEGASPLQIELGRVTRTVTLLAVAFGATFFALGVATGGMPLHDGFVFALGGVPPTSVSREGASARMRGRSSDWNRSETEPALARSAPTSK